MVPWDCSNLLINLVAVDLRDFDFDFTTSAIVEFHTVFENIKGFFFNVCYTTHTFIVYVVESENYIFSGFMRILLTVV